MKSALLLGTAATKWGGDIERKTRVQCVLLARAQTRYMYVCTLVFISLAASS